MGRKETKNKHNHLKTKHKTKDLDEIKADMKEENAEKLLNQEIDHDVAGSAQHYCCLLYTSPSPRDRQKSRMPSSA